MAKAKKTAAKKPAVKTKTAIVAQLLLRKAGATRADILKVTKWTAVSVQQMSKAAGLKLRMKNDDGQYRYFGIR